MSEHGRQNDYGRARDTRLTAMHAREPHLLDVRHLASVLQRLVLVRSSILAACFPVFGAVRGAIRAIRSIRCPIGGILARSANNRRFWLCGLGWTVHTELRHEFDAVFIERDSVTQEANASVFAREREVSWDDPDRSNRVPGKGRALVPTMRARRREITYQTPRKWTVTGRQNVILKWRLSL